MTFCVTPDKRRSMTKYGKKKYHYKSGEEQSRSRNSLRSQLADPKARSKLISGPTDFKHVHHMGAENTNVHNMMAADLTQQKVSFFDFFTFSPNFHGFFIICVMVRL